MRKIIFLDIDGVLNHQQAYADGDCGYDFNEKYEKFSVVSKTLLNILIEQTGAEVVISSTWTGEGLERMQELWKLEGMSGSITGITPHLSIKGFGYTPRGCEIDCYLREQSFYHINWSAEGQREVMVKSNIANYIIIDDDDSDMLYGQRNHFVHTMPAPRNLSGFNEKYYREALRMLSTDVIGLNYVE